MQIFIGNLSKRTTTGHLAELFLPFGAVHAVKIISDRLTGISLGFGYLEMEPLCARLAIRKLNRLLFMNTYMEVNEVFQ